MKRTNGTTGSTEGIRSERDFVESIAMRYARRTGFDVEELIGEASVAFAQARRKFDPSRGTRLSTYAYRAIENRLHSYSSRRSSVRAVEVFPEDPPEGEEILTPEDLVGFLEIVDRTSIDAGFILRLIYEAPEEFFSLTHRTLRTRLRQILRAEGWTWARIGEAFRSLRAALGTP